MAMDALQFLVEEEDDSGVFVTLSGEGPDFENVCRYVNEFST